MSEPWSNLPPLETSYVPSYATDVPLRHSGLGIASLVIAIVAIVGGFATLVLCLLARYLQMSTPGGLLPQAPEAIIVGLGLMCSAGGLLVGLILGIVGLVQSGRRKVCAVLGTVFNALILVGLCTLWGIGMAIQGGRAGA